MAGATAAGPAVAPGSAASGSPGDPHAPPGPHHGPTGDGGASRDALAEMAVGGTILVGALDWLAYLRGKH